MSSCRCQYPGGIVGSSRSWDGRFHPFPCSPTTAAFPDFMAGRLPRHHFRGLLDIHSRYGLSTRCTAERYIGLEGSDGFVTSTAAPIASGWSDRVSRAGLAPAGMTLPCHGAQYMDILIIMREKSTQGNTTAPIEDLGGSRRRSSAPIDKGLVI